MVGADWRERARCDALTLPTFSTAITTTTTTFTPSPVPFYGRLDTVIVEINIALCSSCQWAATHSQVNSKLLAVL